MKLDRTYDLVFGTARVRVRLCSPIQALIFCDSESALGYTSRGIQLWVTPVVYHLPRILIKDSVGDKLHESHLGLQIREIQRSCDEAGQGL